MKKLFSFRKSALFVLYILGFLFALRSALPSYINSSLISSVSGEKYIGIIFSICSFLTLLLFFLMPNILKRYGNYLTTLLLSIINFLSLIGLVFSDNQIVLLLFFIVTYTTTIIIYFCLDIFIEHNTENIETGRIRSIYLTSVNLAWFLSPWLTGILVDRGSFLDVYLVASAIMLPVTLLILYNLKSFKDPQYVNFFFLKTFREIWKNKNIKSILISNFLLQFFFSWMVLYMPIYLSEYIGLDWKTIGIIFTVMLLPFVLIQIPIGRLADKRYGEKEMLTIGFIIMAISTAIIPFIQHEILWVWALLLFTTRIGAATVEVMTDVYFFKNVGEKNVNLISLYRTMSPFAYLVAPLVASVFLIFFPFAHMFYLLGFLMLLALRYTLAIRDTK